MSVGGRFVRVEDLATFEWFQFRIGRRFRSYDSSGVVRSILDTSPAARRKRMP